MTAVDERPVLSSTSTTPRAFVRRNRWWLLLVAGVLVALVVSAIFSGVGRSGSGDPDSYEPSGARGLATLLRAEGVTVTRTTDVATTVAGVTEDSTVFVPQPFLLTDGEISDLQGAGAHLVVATADPMTVAVMGLEALPDDEALEEEERDPGCDYAPAEAAGRVVIGGFDYGDSARNAVSCYDGALLWLPDQDVVLVGSSKPFSNERLDEEGNAALGLQLLGEHDDLRWFVPAPDRALDGEAPARSISDLMPTWVGWAILQLLVVVVLLMLWRGRRLGRVVPEPLPVVVRAAETVEGRGRLYRVAGSRQLAAEALRSGARDRLALRLGAGRHPTPEVLVDLVAERTGRPAPDVLGLLYGPPPVDDDALVRLARALDALTLEVSGS